ncbi:hypothetical protein COOONC_17233 [Cooperia oncophora]
MANDMLARWTLDPQCQKAVVFVVSTDDMKFWVARDDKVPVYADEFTDIFNSRSPFSNRININKRLPILCRTRTW